MINWFDTSRLVALWAVPLVVAVLILAHRWHARAARRFASNTMFARLAPRTDAFRVGLRIVLVAVAVAAIVIAMARPRYGSYLQDITTSGSDVCILLDVSRSMLAEDVKPNRLERAKADILDLVDRLQGERVGLIVFAGTPLMKVPLTTDVDFFRSALRTVDPTAVPRGGSMLGDAILKALDSMESRYDRRQIIVLISDGEDHDSFPEQAAAAAGERDVEIISVGLGDPEQGARIPERDASGNLEYLRHDGQEVWSVLREDVLRELAQVTGGAYIPARTRVYDLGDIYENHLFDTADTSDDLQRRRRYRERYQIFAGLALLCLVVEGLSSAYRREPGRLKRGNI